MRIVPLFDAKNRLSEYVRETASGPVVITKNGKPCAALIHLEEDEDVEAFLLSHCPRFIQLLDASHEKVRRKGGTPLSAVVAEVEAREKRERKRRPRKAR